MQQPRPVDPASEPRPASPLPRLPRPARPGQVYDRFIRVGLVAWAIVGIALAGFLLVRLIQALQVLVPPVLIGVTIVYLLNPMVSLLDRRGVPRLAGALIVYLAFLLLVALAVSLLVPLLTRELTAAINDFPSYLQTIETRVNQLAARFGQRITLDLRGSRLQGYLSDPANRETLLNYVTGLRSFTSSLLHGVVVFVAGVIVAFYLLVDLPRLGRGALAMVPPRHRTDLQELSSQVSRAVGGFFRGQVVVALFVGVASSFGLWLIGLPYWLLVGLVAGLFNLVPLIGPWIAGALAVVIALINGELAMAAWAALALAIVQQLDNHLISPNVMSRTVNLHPVVVILALLLGAAFYGILGMLMAVPIVAAAKICFLFLWVRHIDYGKDLVRAADVQ